ncbi:TPA: hypothetical protein EYP38_04520 [Candidatus Micrarchaeota archaeon]|nr:hypothetical protein [Candidatus Micrarchaeota archaeon]
MRIKLCPKCRKPVEASEYTVSFLILWGGMDPRYRCRKCGYRGPPIAYSDEDDGRKHYLED